jgi:phosphohistidine phosphatase
MMKTLFLLRHAKSSWKDASLADHDRPLNPRGRRDAPRMGRLLADEGLSPGVIVSSTSRRTRETVELLLGELPFSGEVVFQREIYHGGLEEFIDVLMRLDDEISSVMIVGHNPGMEMAVEDLTGNYVRMPTASLAVIELPILLWEDLNLEVEGRLKNFWIPKELF